MTTLDQRYIEAERIALGEVDEEIPVVGVTISEAAAGHLRLGLHTQDGKTLKVRMPATQLLTALALVLLDLAEEHRLHGDVGPSSPASHHPRFALLTAHAAPPMPGAAWGHGMTLPSSKVCSAPPSSSRTRMAS